MFASLSIYGLYEYKDDVFDNLTLPNGMSKDILIPQILSECSDFALIYPNYDFMKMMIGVWSTNEGHIWDRLYKSELIEFNPIENYDRHESMTRAVNSNSKGVNNSSGTMTQTDESENNTDNSNVTNTHDGGTATNGQTAYDSNTFKDTSRTITDGTSNQQNVSSEKGTTKSKSNGCNVRAETSENESAGNEIVTSHIHGNIGVTQAADMLERYREVIPFCTYDYIVNSFKNRFCVQVY